jgi:hypothetical protein
MWKLKYNNSVLVSFGERGEKIEITKHSKKNIFPLLYIKYLLIIKEIIPWKKKSYYYIFRHYELWQ